MALIFDGIPAKDINEVIAALATGASVTTLSDSVASTETSLTLVNTGMDALVTEQSDSEVTLQDLQTNFRLLLRAYVGIGFNIPSGLEIEYINALKGT